MQGRSLLFISFLFIGSGAFFPRAFAQDEFSEFSDAPPAPTTPAAPTPEAPPTATAPPPADPLAEPDPSSSLGQTPSAPSGADEFSEFGETPTAPLSPKATVPSTVPPTAPPGTDEFSEFGEAPAVKPAPAPKSSVPLIPPEPMPAPAPVPEPLPLAAPEPSPVPAPSAPRPEPVAPAPPPQMATGGTDSPDLRKEEQFHRTYKKFNKLPTAAEAWEKATGAGKAQVYEVQPGDTLWDVSQTLFGDSQFWPKIWSLNNDQVLNPHLITPSMKIKFYPGGLIEAPSLAVQDAETPPVVASPPLAKDETQPGQTPQTIIDETPPLPKPSRRSRRLQDVPASLPSYNFAGLQRSKDVRIDNSRKPIPNPLVYLTHYVSEGNLTTLGEIRETERALYSASEYQYVIVELEDASQKVVHVVRDIEEVRNPENPHGTKARMIEVQGELKILEKVSADENFYRAMVTKSLTRVEVGSRLVAGPAPKVSVTPSTVTPAIEAALVGGQYSALRKLYPRYTFVFIDAGTTGGLHNGQTVNVFANLKTRNNKTIIKNHNRLLGTVKILTVTDNFATAYVTEAYEDLQIGDHIGGAATLAVGESADKAAPVHATAADDLPAEGTNGDPDGLEL